MESKPILRLLPPSLTLLFLSAENAPSANGDGGSQRRYIEPNSNKISHLD
jgi:hypothetical protein